MFNKFNGIETSTPLSRWLKGVYRKKERKNGRITEKQRKVLAERKTKKEKE
jgi:hypothetical protein